MKKNILCLLLTSLLVLVGCAQNNKVALNTSEQTIAEFSDKFVYTLATVLKDKTEATYKYFNRGDEVNIISEDDKYYYIVDKYLTLAIDKDFVRKESEGAFESYDGYTKSGSGVYTDTTLTERIRVNSVNEIVKVIDSIGSDFLIVEINGQQGIMVASSVSRTPFSTYVPTRRAPSSTSSDSSGGSSGGGDSSGGDTPSVPDVTYDISGGNSGGGSSSGSGDDDVTFQLKSEGEYETVLLTNSTTEKATIKVNDTPAYIILYNRGDTVYVLESGSHLTKIVVNGRRATIETLFIRESDQVYIPWNGYSRYNRVVYADYELTTPIATLSLNTVVHIVDEIGDRFVIELNDGTIAYMQKEDISNVMIYFKTTTTTRTTTPTEETPSSGGSTPAPAPAPAPTPTPEEWTDPR